MFSLVRPKRLFLSPELWSTLSFFVKFQSFISKYPEGTTLLNVFFYTSSSRVNVCQALLINVFFETYNLYYLLLLFYIDHISFWLTSVRLKMAVEKSNKIFLTRHYREEYRRKFFSKKNRRYFGNLGTFVDIRPKIIVFFEK